MQNIKIVGLDADDTLWVNEPHYRKAEHQMEVWLSEYSELENIRQKLFEIEMQNLPLYGYGGKAFTLSMIETALKLTDNKVPQELIAKIIDLGKALLDVEMELLDGVKETLYELSQRYKLILATKGDLLDQERKLKKSGLENCFHHIEVMSDKKTDNYRKLLTHLDIQPQEFIMVGNSLRSDILPVVELGAKAIHIPYHTTWIHEEVEVTSEQKKSFITLQNIRELLNVLN